MLSSYSSVVKGPDNSRGTGSESPHAPAITTHGYQGVPFLFRVDGNGPGLCRHCRCRSPPRPHKRAPPSYPRRVNASPFRGVPERLRHTTNHLPIDALKSLLGNGYDRLKVIFGDKPAL